MAAISYLSANGLCLGGTETRLISTPFRSGYFTVAHVSTVTAAAILSGDPLWNFINIIGATGPQAMEPRLPINRIDELGHIARAYNNLLDTLNEQYDTLEMKVKERTLALAEAKRAAEQANRRKATI